MGRKRMGRKRNFTHSPQPPFACFFGCGRELATKYSLVSLDWEWFTGYGRSPIHFCPTCRRSRQFEIDRMREKLGVKPKNYPQEFAELMIGGEMTTEEKVLEWLSRSKGWEAEAATAWVRAFNDIAMAYAEFTGGHIGREEMDRVLSEKCFTP